MLDDVGWRLFSTCWDEAERRRWLLVLFSGGDSRLNFAQFITAAEQRVACRDFYTQARKLVVITRWSYSVCDDGDGMIY